MILFSEKSMNSTIFLFLLYKNMFSTLFNFLFTRKPEHSELSHPWTRQPRVNSKNDITRQILMDNLEARDNEELFLWLVESKCTSRMDIVYFDRSWRYVQQRYEILRWITWEARQKKAELYRKNI